LAQGSQVIVIYMGMKHLDQISAALMAGGRKPDEPVLIVREATTQQQFTLETTLSEAAEAARASGVLAPAIICIGRAVRLRDALGWMEKAGGGRPPVDLE